MSVSIVPKAKSHQPYKICTLVAFRCEGAKKVYVTFTTTDDIKKFHYGFIKNSKRRVAAGISPTTLDLFLVNFQTEPLILSANVKPHEKRDAIRAYETRLEVLGYTVIKRTIRRGNRHSPVQIWDI